MSGDAVTTYELVAAGGKVQKQTVYKTRQGGEASLYCTMLSTAFHVTVLVHHVYVNHLIMTQIDYSKTDDDYVHNVMKKFKWRYFTGWNFFVQTIYFTICVVEDLMRLRKYNSVSREWLRGTKDFIFTAIMFPCTLFVTLAFWGLYHIDREFVFPKAVDAIIPSWINHSIHTIIIVALVIEMRITRHRYSKRSLGLAALAIYVTVYDILFFTAFLSDGAWLYPVYYVLNWFYRILLLIYFKSAIFGFYILGELLSTKLVGMEMKRINEKLHGN